MAKKINYDEYFYLDKDFREMISNKETLRKPLEKFLDNIIDDITLGVIFEIHRKHKTRGLDDDPEPSTSTMSIVPVVPYKTPGVVDIFGYEHSKKIQDCDCPICERMVSAFRFAPHLATCMGMGRRKNPSRNAASHSIISTSSNNSSNSNNSTKDKEEDSTYSSLHSDDCDDDDDWNSRQKKRKKKHRSKSKKGKGTPKKANSMLSDIDSVNVDGDEDTDIMLRDIIQDNSNQSSPADSVSSSNASLKKREKSSKKKNKRDRASPNINLD